MSQNEFEKPYMQQKEIDQALQLISEGDFESLETLAREYNYTPEQGKAFSRLIIERKAQLAQGNQVIPQAEVPDATAAQKEEIIRLLNNVLVTRHEKTKVLLNLNKMDQEGAGKTIEQLKKTIKDREDQANAA